MKLQTILMSLVLIVITLASALVSYSIVAQSRRASPASSLRQSATRSEGIELASMGFQVGNT